MPPRGTNPDLVRIVEGLSGRVKIHMELIIRFDYGSIVPWVRRRHGGLEAVAGPDALILHTPIETHGEDLKTVAEFTVAKGDRVPFVLTWFRSYETPPREIDPEHALRDTENFWNEWSGRCTHRGPWRDAVVRSLITLKGLTYAPTGGIVAALTTSLPEEIGGVRNWDYRFCWLRDATFTLFSLLGAGYHEEACAWREWLLRAIAGSPSQLQIMYGVRGERRLIEHELPWLSGYEGSQPVRQGNAAAEQFQIDVFGEVVDAMYHAQRAGLEASEADWRMQVALLNFLESKWSEPDEGIWEIRGESQQFTHSKVMAWVAFDRAVKLVENFNCAGNDHLARWKKLRAKIHREVCTKGYHPKKKAFTQTYGSTAMDASILMLPLVGFLPPDDERVLGHDRGGRARPVTRRFRSALSARRVHHRWPARGRGRFPALFFLAGRLPAPGRSQKRGAAFVRAPARPAQRRRSARGRIRSEGEASAREFSAGFHPRRPGQHRPGPLRGT